MEKKEVKEAQIGFRTTKRTKKELDRIAREQRRTVSFIVGDLVEKGLGLTREAN
jgi:predicted DNA-binding protein